jgi:hypothetical protein
MAAENDQRHGGEEEQQTAREHRLGKIHERDFIRKVRFHGGGGKPPFAGQVPDRIQSRRQEDDTGDGQEQKRYSVQADPAI